MRNVRHKFTWHQVQTWRTRAYLFVKVYNIARAPIGIDSCHSSTKPSVVLGAILVMAVDNIANLEIGHVKVVGDFTHVIINHFHICRSRTFIDCQDLYIGPWILDGHVLVRGGGIVETKMKRERCPITLWLCGFLVSDYFRHRANVPAKAK